MPPKLKVEVVFTPEFKRNLRALAKKYPHIRSDVQSIIEQIQHGEFVGDQIQGTSYTIFKVRKVINIRPFIGEGISAALRDEAYFHQVTLEDGGGITWPNDYDFCPNFLRDDVPAVTVVST